MIDVKKIRKDFPILNNQTKMQGQPLCFLDNASTTLKPQVVIDAGNEYYERYSANVARADYDLGVRVDQEVASTRNKVAHFINAKSPNEVVFTSGTTEALNLIAYGYGLNHLKKDDEIIVSIVEHAANLLPWYMLKEKLGCKISFVPVDEAGNISISDLDKMTSSKTKIIALSHVSNVLAQTLDVKNVARIAHKNGAILVLDGAQSVPHMEIDVQDLDCDFLVFSGHKMLGPTGIGVLYGKAELLEKTDPFILGGGMNLKYDMCGTIEYLKAPSKLEAGTLNIAGIVALGAAIDYLNSIGMKNIEEYEKEIREYAIKRLKSVPNITIYNETATAGIIAFNVDNIFAQDVGTYLNSKGICVRTGQHCSKILSDRFESQSTVRVSIYVYTDRNDIDRLIDALMHVEDFLDAYF